MEMRSFRILLWALTALALIGGAFVYYVNLKSTDKQLAGTFDIGGPFSMTTQNGQAVSIYFSAPRIRAEPKQIHLTASSR